MKKRMSVMVGAALLVLALGPTEARAVSDNAAVIIHRNNGIVQCGLFINSVPLFTDEEVVFVITESGSWTLTCHFDIPEGLDPDNVIMSSGFQCTNTFNGQMVTTTNSHAMATPGGRAKLKCQAHGIE